MSFTVHQNASLRKMVLPKFVDCFLVQFLHSTNPLYLVIYLLLSLLLESGIRSHSYVSSVCETCIELDQFSKEAESSLLFLVAFCSNALRQSLWQTHGYEINILVCQM